MSEDARIDVALAHAMEAAERASCDDADRMIKRLKLCVFEIRGHCESLFQSQSAEAATVRRFLSSRAETIDIVISSLERRREALNASAAPATKPPGRNFQNAVERRQS